MKRLFFLCFSLSIVCSLMAQKESDYQFIKSGYKWVENFVDANGCKYTGFVNANNQPDIYGTYIDQAGMKMIGQFNNGKANGVATFISNTYQYFGETKDDECSGIGRQTLIGNGEQHVTSLFKNNKSSDGLACTTKGGVIIRGGQNGENTLDYFPRALYDEKLGTVKAACENNNVRYIENTTVGNYTYSGGWKNGQPYYYGTFKSRNRSRAIYGIGYIIYDESKQEIDVDYSKPMERWYEDYYECYYRKLEISENGDTTRLLHGLKEYEYTIVGKDGKYKRNDIFHFGREDEFTKFYKYVNGRPWGIFGKNKYIQEGYLDIKEKEEPLEGKLLTTEGELHQYSNGNHYIYYPNGDKMLVHEHDARLGYMLVTYTSTSGDYTIGWFGQAPYGNDNPDYFKYVKPIYARSYFSDGELKKQLNDDYDSQRINQINKEKVLLLVEGPESGIATYNFEDGRVYQGEWKNHMMTGYGKTTFPDGTIEEGTYEKGHFVQGVQIKADGLLTAGKWNNGDCIDIDSIIHPNGEWEKYILIGGKKEKLEKRYYSINIQSGRADYSLWISNISNPQGADCVYEGWAQDATITFLTNKNYWEKGDYWRGQAFLTYHGGMYLNCSSVSSQKRTYPSGVYEGGVNKDGKPVHGKFVFTNGTIYEGLFICKGLDGLSQTTGEGILTLADGTSVNAVFNANYTYNEAKIKYSNGDSYHGAVINGARNGNGEYLFANGDKLSGEWLQNNISKAIATYTWTDGRKFVGELKGNKFGKGVFYAADGSEVDKKLTKSWLCNVPVSTIATMPK